MAEIKDDNDPPLWSCGEKDSFANGTMKVRLPKMVRSIIASNQDRYNQSILDDLERLAIDMETDKMIQAPKPQNDSYDDYWNSFYKHHFEGKSWQSVPFYPIEAYLFRKILAIVQYNDPKSTFRTLDPYERSKLGELIRIDIWTQLSQTLLAIHAQNDESSSNKLYFALTCCMWSNKMDLNFKPGKSEKLETVAQHSNDKNLLHDDRHKIINYFMKIKDENTPKSVAIVCDNSGAEFINDLMLCDTLLSYKWTDKIALHLKLYPTYVSDVTLMDMDRHLSHLYARSKDHALDEQNRNELGNLYQRLTKYLNTKQLRLKHDHFWNTGDCFDKIPKDYMDEWSKNNEMVIFKGDANYRRLVLVKMWSPFKPFDDVIGSYFKCNVITLRTMKSDCIIGLDKSVVAKVQRVDEHWRHNGKRGVIQCYLK
eukprot:207431_1